MNFRKFWIQCLALTILVVAALVIFVPMARADGPPPPDVPVEDSYFREEAPERMVECADNVFVPMGEGGTWECPLHPAEPDANDPRVAEQLPEEVIGRQVDCPDGSVGRVIDLEGGTTCDPEEVGLRDLPRDQEVISLEDLLLYGGGGFALALVTIGTLYMIFRKGSA